MDELRIYDRAKSVPASAKKSIQAGRLKGMTDISPMWRIRVLTELFGPCGIGWWYNITHKEIVRDDRTNQVAAFVDIMLYYVDPASGKESHGIPGTGGATFVAQERNGPYMSDECFKMALTDAISVAAKALGVGADVYWEAGSKYASIDHDDAPPIPPEQAEYYAAMEKAKAIIARVVDAESANVESLNFKDIRHAMTSQRDSAMLWNRRIKELGLVFSGAQGYLAGGAK